jgi:hypothetical protein
LIATFFFIKDSEIGAESALAVGPSDVGSRDGSGEIDGDNVDRSATSSVIVENLLTLAADVASREVGLVHDRLGNGG